jgi:hypothetical protein
MSTDFDAEADQPTQEIAKNHEWNGKPLFPFSVGRQMAFQRLDVAGQSIYEAACALVRLCQMTPEEVNRVRGAEVEPFLLGLPAWAEKEGIGAGDANDAKTTELLKLYDAVWLDLYDAESVEPVEKSKGGNE